MTRKSYMSVDWSGDLQPKNGDNKPNAFWPTDKKVESISRALLGHYFEEVFWKPAISVALDQLQDVDNISFISKLKLVEEDRLIEIIRNRIANTYRFCSKGIHHEFVIPVTALYDTSTVRNSITDAREMLVQLSIIANLSGTMLFPLPKEEMVAKLTAMDGEAI